MRFLELRKNDYRFNGKTQNPAKYIEHLASITNTEITNWPIKPFLKDDGDFISERRALNEIFFTFKPVEEKELASDPKAVLALRDILFSSLNRHLDDKTAQVEHAASNYKSALKSLSRYEKAYVQRSLELNAFQEFLNKTRRVFVDQLNEILKDDFWSLELDDKGPFFVTQNIVLTYLNKKQGREQAAVLGRLRVDLKVGSDSSLPFEFEVKRYKDANHILRYAHPHVSTGGNVCFGHAGSMALRKAIADINLPMAFAILKDVLKSYNEGDSYYLLDQFVPESEADPDALDPSMVLPEYLDIFPNNEDEEFYE